MTRRLKLGVKRLVKQAKKKYEQWRYDDYSETSEYFLSNGEFTYEEIMRGDRFRLEMEKKMKKHDRDDDGDSWNTATFLDDDDVALLEAYRKITEY